MQCPLGLFSTCSNYLRLPRLDLLYRFPLCTYWWYPSTLYVQLAELSWVDQRQHAAPPLLTSLGLPRPPQPVPPLAGHRQRGVAGPTRPLEGKLETEAAPCPFLPAPWLSPSKVLTLFGFSAIFLDQSWKGCKFDCCSTPAERGLLQPHLSDGTSQGGPWKRGQLLMQGYKVESF